MVRSLSENERRDFARTLKHVGATWRTMFADEDFYSLSYLDLFTEIWLKGGDPVIKTDCYRFMGRVSRQTAKKYVERAIERGYLLEQDNPHDRRSKLIQMSRELRILLDRNYDDAAAEFRRALRRRRQLGEA